MDAKKAGHLLIVASAGFFLTACDQKQQTPQQQAQPSAPHLNKTQVETEQQIASLLDTVNELRGRISVLEAQNLNARLGLLEGKSAPARAPVSDPPKPQIDAADLKDAVAACVQSVHQSAPADYSGDFYRKFDAYYDEGSGKVRNNAQLVGDQPPKFLFEKCLTTKGYSLR